MSTQTNGFNELLTRLSKLEKEVADIKTVLASKFQQTELPVIVPQTVDLAKCPDGVPEWLYELVSTGSPTEREIMMRQLVRNQALEFYVMSAVSPPNQIEKNEKAQMQKAYTPSASLGEYAFDKDFQMGNVKGNWCDFSSEGVVAKKFYSTVEKIDSPELVNEIKTAYIEALKYHKNKYNKTQKSFGKVFVPEIALESSKTDMSAYWKRLPGLIKKVQSVS